MDAELMQEEALRNTFAHLFSSHSAEATAANEEEDDDVDDTLNFDDEHDVDMNLLMNMLAAQAETFGVPAGPFAQMLSQLGLDLPRAPPLNEKNT
jgi:hypothetical protein